jgi:hypothetical protein
MLKSELARAQVGAPREDQRRRVSRPRDHFDLAPANQPRVV